MKSKVLAGIVLLATGLMVGSCSDDNYNIHTDSIISSVVTGSAEVTAISATITGSVKDLSGQAESAYSAGVYYSTDGNPTTGTKVPGTLEDNGDFTVTVTGLSKGVTYYYCTYVTLQSKLSYYGDVKSFTTTDARIATAGAASVTAVSALLGGTLNGVTDLIQSESASLVYGVVLSAREDESAVKEGRMYQGLSSSNSYNVSVDALVPGTTYYYMAYMKLLNGYVYGDMKSFTTEKQEMEFVDLGLSVEWATWNIGATRAEELGGLYGWGDITGLKVSTDAADYGANENISDTEYDICVAAGSGFMPSFKEVRELMDNCSKEWVTVNGVGGYEFTAVNGNSIFLPAGGSREGYETTQSGVAGNYWSGTVETSSADHAYTMAFTEGSARWSTAMRYDGLSVRAVRKPLVASLAVDNSKLAMGEIESGTGNFRIEMYNEYGSTKEDPAIHIDRLTFNENCVIKFRLSGFSFKEGAAGKYRAAMQYAAYNWYPSYWGSGNARYDCEVTGDGEYTVWCETGGAASEGAVVFCIDIMDNIIGDLEDAAAAKAEIISIELDRPVDWVTDIAVDNSKILFVNKDDDKVNGRVEIYNEYGATKENPGVDVTAVNFNGRMSINFTISGIDGNLAGSADGSYLADISYAAFDWNPSYWGGGIGSANVSADGTYDVYCQLSGDSKGAVVWCVELSNLWKDLIDPSLVKVEINSITTEN